MTYTKGVIGDVPYVVTTPRNEATAPAVIGWHLMDCPRSEVAMAAALPMESLDAWRIYLGLPMFSSRSPEGGFAGFFEIASRDPVMAAHWPVNDQAVSEFATVWPKLSAELGLGDRPLGLFGGSAGAAVALRVAVEGDVDVKALALVSPLTVLKDTVDAVGAMMGMPYKWSSESKEVAATMDFVARAGELVAKDIPTMIVLGSEDSQDAILAPAHRLYETLHDRYPDRERIRITTIDGMPHGFAEEPGTDAAPQTEHAKAVDREIVEWFGQWL